MLEISDIRPLRDDELVEWDKLVADSPEGTVYHSSIWLKAISKAVRQKAVIYGFFSNKILLGGMPLAIRKKGPISIAQRAFATPYSWIVMRKDLPLRQSLDLSKVYQFISRSFSKATLTNSPFGITPNYPKNWLTEERSTYILNIKNTDVVWGNFASELRNRIRKAQGANVSVQKLQHTKEFYSLYRDTFSRQGKDIPFTEGRFIEFMNHYCPKHAEIILSA